MTNWYIDRPNALTIHYTANDQVIRADELILVDAGCEYKSVVNIHITSSQVSNVRYSGYASDISTLLACFSTRYKLR